MKTSHKPRRGRHLNVTANQVAHQLVLNGKTNHSIRVKSKINRCVPSSEPKYNRPFTEEELNTGIKSLKNGKVIGLITSQWKKSSILGSKQESGYHSFSTSAFSNKKKFPEYGE